MALPNPSPTVDMTPYDCMQAACPKGEGELSLGHFPTAFPIHFTAPTQLRDLVATYLTVTVTTSEKMYGYLKDPFGCGLIADWLEEHTDQLQPTPEPELLQAICTELRKGLQPVG